MSFWPTLLTARGLSASTIGVLLAIGPWLRFAINPRIGILSDTRWGPRRVFLAFATLLCAGSLLLFASKLSLSLLVLSAILMAVGFSPLASLADASTLVHVRDDYARTRLWGSLSFIVCSLGLGYWLESHDVESVAYTLMLTSTLVLVTGLLIPGRPPAQARALPQTYAATTSNLTMPPLLGVCILAGLLNASHAVLYGFGTLHWRSLGISDGHIGALWTVGVIAEILIFMLADRLKHGATARWLLWVACLGGVVRWLLLAWSTSLAWQVVAQILHAATFACAHLGILRRLSQIVRDDRMASAVTKVAGIGGGLAMGVGSILAGVAYERFAGQSFLLAAAVSLAATLVLWSFSRTPHESGDESDNNQLLM